MYKELFDDIGALFSMMNGGCGNCGSVCDKSRDRAGQACDFQGFGCDQQPQGFGCGQESRGFACDQQPQGFACDGTSCGEKEEKEGSGCDQMPCMKEKEEKKEEKDQDDASAGGFSGLMGGGPVMDLMKCLFNASNVDYNYED